MDTQTYLSAESFGRLSERDGETEVGERGRERRGREGGTVTERQKETETDRQEERESCLLVA